MTKEEQREYHRQYSRKWRAKNKEKARKYARKWVAEQKAKGLCARCNKPALNGHTLCTKHLKYQNKVAAKSRAKSYAKKKAQGICAKCNKPALKGYTRCFEHLLQNNKYGRKWRANHKEEIAAYDKKRREQLKKEGKCPCGAPLDPDADRGYIKCINCRQRIYRERLI